MSEVRYQFCMKQFKPLIVLIVALTAFVIGWTVYNEQSSQHGFMMGPGHGGRLIGRGPGNGFMRAATAPPIRFGAKAPHPDWGACDNCHDVFTGRGRGGPGGRRAAFMPAATAPPIPAGAKPPHPDWGTCTNCHTITGGGTPAAVTMQVAMAAPPLSGVWLRPITPATADKLGLENTDGVIVSGVQENSKAFEGGLRTGDVIQRIDNAKVDNVNRALGIIAKKQPQDTVKLQVLRNGRARKIFVEVTGTPGRGGAAPITHAAAGGPLAPTVAVAATGKDASAQVAPVFGGAAGFVLVNPQDGTTSFLPNPGTGTLTAGQQAAAALMSAGVDAVIVGNIGPSSMRRLQQSGINVYTGTFGPVRKVINQYRQGALLPAGRTVIPKTQARSNPVDAVPVTKIAVASTGSNLNARVAKDLGLAPYLVIYDPKTGDVEVVPKDPAPDNGTNSTQTAHLLVDRGASAVIAGNVSSESVRTLTDLGVFAFAGVSGDVGQAISMYRAGKLQSSTVPNRWNQTGGNGAVAL